MEWPSRQLGVWFEAGDIEGFPFYDREEAIGRLLKK